MKHQFEVLVSLKEGLLDPQGKAVQAALPALGWSNVTEVRVGKVIELVVEADDPTEARGQVEEMALRFLSNPVIEDFTVVSTDGEGADEP